MSTHPFGGFQRVLQKSVPRRKETLHPNASRSYQWTSQSTSQAWRSWGCEFRSGTLPWELTSSFGLGVFLLSFPEKNVDIPTAAFLYHRIRDDKVEKRPMIGLQIDCYRIWLERFAMHSKADPDDLRISMLWRSFLFGQNTHKWDIMPRWFYCVVPI